MSKDSFTWYVILDDDKIIKEYEDGTHRLYGELASNEHIKIKEMWIEKEDKKYGVSMEDGAFYVSGVGWLGRDSFNWSEGIDIEYPLTSTALRSIFFHRVTQGFNTALGPLPSHIVSCIGWQTTITEGGKSIELKKVMYVHPDGKVCIS